MKELVYALQLEDLSHGIKVCELNNPKRFEAAGLGIIDASQIEYHGPIGLYYIYSGDWNSKNKKIIKSIVPTTDIDVFGEFYAMIKNIEQQILDCKKIKELENLVMSMNIDRFRKFACLESTDKYFNQYGLCGVVCDGDKYIWCHQDFPEGGDRPNSYYTVRPFDTIDELIEYVKRHIKVDLSLRYTTETLHIQYLCNHPKYGYCIVCSELIDGIWTDGYYIFNGDFLQRQCDAR